jgi:fumarate hydratase class II
MTKTRTRIERDSMGEIEVPEDAYYGASTMRAVLNFPISGIRFPRRLIRALGLIKKAAAQVNRDLGLLEPHVADAIMRAADEVAEGKLDSEFPLDIYQTGSGTSTNTNANEVIANRASELLGGDRGADRRVHPNDHVNKCQSSNDVIPTAIQLAAAEAIEEELLPSLRELHDALKKKSEEFWPVVKTGRTHIQDATPIRLGQEFLGYAGQVKAGERRLGAALQELLAVPLGGTAVGTGINAHPEFPGRACALLAQWMKLPVVETPDHFWAQATLDTLVAAHGALRTVATSLWKIGSDIRLMGCGPVAGIAEIAIPAVQPGSSIMPGKVNPVIVESLTMAVARVLGNDLTVTLCGQSGSYFELNVMMPVAGYATLESISLLARSAENFARRCVTGIEVTPRATQLLEKQPMLATALTPKIGYDEAAKIAKEALKTGKTVRELARERGLSEPELDDLLDLQKMTEPGLGGIGGG